MLVRRLLASFPWKFRKFISISTLLKLPIAIEQFLHQIYLFGFVYLRFCSTVDDTTVAKRLCWGRCGGFIYRFSAKRFSLDLSWAEATVAAQRIQTDWSRLLVGWNSASDGELWSGQRNSESLFSLMLTLMCITIQLYITLQYNRIQYNYTLQYNAWYFCIMCNDQLTSPNTCRSKIIWVSVTKWVNQSITFKLPIQVKNSQNRKQNMLNNNSQMSVLQLLQVMWIFKETIEFLPHNIKGSTFQWGATSIWALPK